MKRTKTWHYKLILFFLSFVLAFPVGSFSALAAGKVTHTPPEGKYIPGFRIQLDVEIQESTDLLAARCYFKTKQDQNFAFTDLFNQGGGKFKAVLPAPWINSKAVEYLFVAVDKDKQVTRTPLFVLEEGQTKEATAWQDASQVKEVRLDTMQEGIENIEAIHRQLKNNYRDRLPEYQSTDSADSLMVQTELSKEVMPLNGFYDKAVVTEVADNAKYGFMADGLYTPEQIAAAEAAGVPTAKAGMSTAAKVGIGIVAVAAIAAGVAVAASGSSSDDDGGGGGEVTPETLVGNWYVTEGSRTTAQWYMYQTLNSNGTFTMTEYINGQPQSDSGTWSYNSNTRYFTYNVTSGGGVEGVISGSADDFTVAGHWIGGAPGTWHWVRR